MTTQVASIAACLPEHMWAIGSGPRPAARQAKAASGVVGERRRGLQVRRGEPGLLEDRVHALDVAGLAFVARAGQRERRAVEFQPGPQHRDGLQRLERRARQERAVRVARPHPRGPVGAERDRVPGVHRFDHPAAVHPGEHLGPVVDHPRDATPATSPASRPGESDKPPGESDVSPRRVRHITTDTGSDHGRSVARRESSCEPHWVPLLSVSECPISRVDRDSPERLAVSAGLAV